VAAGGGAARGSEDREVRRYVDAIAAEQRPLFDRVHALIMEVHPDAEVALSYGMPAYRVGRRRLNVGVWKHGVSIYGWRADRDGGFAARHPTLSSGKGTLRIRPRDAQDITDGELRALLSGAFEPDA
jgi:hypothetical protein